MSARTSSTPDPVGSVITPPPEELLDADEAGRRKVADQWSRMPAPWRRFDVGLLKVSEYVLCVVGVLFAAMITLEVLSRYVFDFSLYFVNAAARLLLVWFFMLGAGVALRHGAHVGFELLVSKLTPRAQRIVVMVGLVCAAAFSAEMLYAGVVALGPAWRQTEPGLDIPLAWPILAIPVGFALLLYHGTVLMWIELRGRSGEFGMTLIVIGLIFFATIVIGVPIAFGMGLAGATWIMFFQGMEPTILARRFYYALNSFPLLAIPLFIMLGILADRAQMLPKLVVWLQMMFGWTRGGMAYINVVSSMLFAGISGTAVSDIASMGRVQIQMMTRVGYPLAYSSALTAATAIIAPIIPPSVAMIIYALAVGNISVGAMFAAGAIPGLLFSLGFLVMCYFTTRRGKYGVIEPWPTARAFALQTVRVIPLLILPIIIVGGIFSGVFTVTESAGVGVAYTVVIGLLAKPRLRWKDIYDATLYSAVVSAVAGLLLGAGAIVSYILTYNRVTQDLADLLTSLAVGPLGYMLMVVVVLLVLGMLMDAVPIMIALAPLLAPIAKSYGISEVHFGLVFVVTCMIGLVTPPVGILLFMTSSITGLKLERLSAAVVPFVIWMIIVVILMVFVPSLTLWLPKVLGLGTR